MVAKMVNQNNTLSIRLLIGLLLAIGIMCVLPFEAYGAASDHSRDDAVSYAMSLQGSKHDVDNGSYDCVDIAKLYYSYLGEPVERGHAYTYTTKHLPNGWERVYSNPQPGDVAAWGQNSGMSSYGHVGIVVDTGGAKLGILDQSTGQQRAARVSYYNRTPTCYLRPNFQDASHNPYGYLDSASGGAGKFTISGWAKDPDDESRTLEIHAYVGGPAGVGEGHVLTAGAYRADVGNHAYATTVNTNRVGTQKVYVYAINIGQGNDNTLLGVATVIIQSDSEAPRISEVRVSEIQPGGYRVSCKAIDNKGVSRVLFPTWTSNGGQDDLVWHEGVKSGDTYYYDVKASEHGNASGLYHTHIYADDSAGNRTGPSAADVLMPKAMANYGHSTYFLFDETNLSWEQVERRCEGASKGGCLVSIGSAGEEATVESLVKSGGLAYYMIGASDADTEGLWRWPLGETLDAYSNWGSNEPTGGASENYSAIRKEDMRWVDYDGSSWDSIGYIMEVENFYDFNGAETTDFPEGVYTIHASGDEKYVLDISEGSTNSQANLQLYEANGTGAQRFGFSLNDDGTYTITNIRSGLVLDVSYAGLIDYTNVWQYEANGSAAQRWYIEETGDGFYSFRSKVNNLYLDIYGGQLGNGTNVQTYHGNATASQKFRFKRASAPVASNVQVYDITTDGYKVRFDLDAPQGVKQILLPTWTAANGQDDIIWYEATEDDGAVSYEVKVADHGGERAKYSTHIYVYDTFGNRYGLGEIDDILIPTAIASWSDSTYYLIDSPESVLDAKRCADRQWFTSASSAHLASIESEMEQAVLEALIKQGRYSGYWIGANDAESEGDWAWDSGELLAYTNWRSGEPDGDESENYAAMDRDSGQWQDYSASDDVVKGYIIEYEGDDRVGPDVSEVGIESVDEMGYTVTFKVDDPSGIDVVKIAAWNEGAGEDSAVEETSGVRDDGYVYHRIDIADHDGATGVYKTRIQAFDSLGNEAVVGIADVGNVLVPDAAVPTDDGMFYRFDQSFTWTEAKEYIENGMADGMQLASVLSEDESDSVALLLAGASKSAYWIGLSDADSTGAFSWADGSALDYNRWASGQPSASDDARYVSILASSAKWYSSGNVGIGTKTSNMGFIAKAMYAEDEAALCNDDHQWGVWTVYAEATCTEDGEEIRTCERCGAAEFRETSKLAHAITATVRMNEQESTCTRAGSYDSVVFCVTCGEELSRERVVIPMVEHDWIEGDVTVAPSCEEAGSCTYTCATCGAVKSESVPGFGHVRGTAMVENEAKANSCMQNDKYDEVVYCAVCGKELSRETKTGAVGAHVEVIDPAVDPTCISTGLTEGVHCSTCGKPIKEQVVVPMLEHRTTKVAEVAPTCENAGSIAYYKCADCDRLFEDEATERPVEDVANTVVPALGHDWGEWKVVLAPTEDSDGVRKRTCVNDPSHVQTEEIPSLAHVHALVLHPALEPTCEQAGSRAYYECAGCSQWFEDEAAKHQVEDKTGLTLPALGHNWAAPAYSWNANNSSVTATRACARDAGHVETETVGASAGGISATCEQSGIFVYTSKAFVNQAFAAQTKTIQVPAMGHDWDSGIVSIEPGCETAGVMAYKCAKDSSHVRTESIPALGHDYAATIVKPTRDLEGYTLHKCARCGDEYRTDFVPALAPSATADILAAAISGIPDKATYTGEALSLSPIIRYGSTALREGADYTVEYLRDGVATKDLASAGEITVRIIGVGSYTGFRDKTCTVEKATAFITAKKTSKSVKVSSAKKKAQSFKLGVKSSSGGKLSYKVVKRNSKVIFKKGKVTLRKGTGKGAYIIRVKAISKAAANYKKTSRIFKIVFRVK